MNMYDYIHLVGTRVVRIRIPISFENGFSRLGSLRSRTRRASHKSRGITHQTPPNSVRQKPRLVAERERGREYENTWPVPFAWPGEEKKGISAKKARWKARLPAEPAGGIPERRKEQSQDNGRESNSQPCWSRLERREGEPEGGWKSALWECQLDSSFLFAPNGFKSERVTYHSKSMRTNLSPSSSDFNRIE